MRWERTLIWLVKFLWEADEVGVLSDLHQVFLLLAWLLGQVLTCSEVAGPETGQVLFARVSVVGRSKKSGRFGKGQDKMTPCSMA